MTFFRAFDDKEAGRIVFNGEISYKDLVGWDAEKVQEVRDHMASLFSLLTGRDKPVDVLPFLEDSVAEYKRSRASEIVKGLLSQDEKGDITLTTEDGGSIPLTDAGKLLDAFKKKKADAQAAQAQADVAVVP